MVAGGGGGEVEEEVIDVGAEEWCWERRRNI